MQLGCSLAPFKMKYCFPLLRHISANGLDWQIGKEAEAKSIEIDLLQENRNKDVKGLIQLMGANKTEKAIDRVSRAAAGVRKIVVVFEDQALIKPKSSAHSHKASTEDEKKILAVLRKLKAFSETSGSFHKILLWEFHLTHLKIWMKKSSVHGCKDTRETLQYTFLNRLIHVVRKRIICKLS